MCEKKAGAGLVRHQVLGDLARSAGQLALIGRTCARNAASQTQKRTRVLQLNTTANAFLWQCRGGGQEAEAEEEESSMYFVLHTHTRSAFCAFRSPAHSLCLCDYTSLCSGKSRRMRAPLTSSPHHLAFRTVDITASGQRKDLQEHLFRRRLLCWSRTDCDRSNRSSDCLAERDELGTRGRPVASNEPLDCLRVATTLCAGRPRTESANLIIIKNQNSALVLTATLASFRSVRINQRERAREPVVVVLRCRDDVMPSDAERSIAKMN